MKKYNKHDHKLLVTWAADCAERVLPLFESVYPKDERPSRAIQVCRIWVCTGEFKMTSTRGSSLGAHAAAREAKDNPAACFAARAAGQAAAVAHVPQHALGAAYYALKAVGAADPAHAEANVLKELEWQRRHGALGLREEVLKRIILQKNRSYVRVKIQKDPTF